MYTLVLLVLAAGVLIPTARCGTGNVIIQDVCMDDSNASLSLICNTSGMMHILEESYGERSDNSCPVNFSTCVSPNRNSTLHAICNGNESCSGLVSSLLPSCSSGPLNISYTCIRESVNVCTEIRERTEINGSLYLHSTGFPNSVGRDAICNCNITGHKMKVEIIQQRLNHSYVTLTRGNETYQIPRATSDWVVVENATTLQLIYDNYNYNSEDIWILISGSDSVVFQCWTEVRSSMWSITSRSTQIPTSAAPPSTRTVTSSTTAVPPSTTAVPPSTTAVPPPTTAAPPSTRPLPATTERSEATETPHNLSPTPLTTVGQAQTPQSSFGIPQTQDEMPTRLIAAGVASGMIVLIAAIIAVALCRKPTNQKKRKPKPERKTGIGKSLGVTCGIRVQTTQVNANSATAGVISTVIPNSQTQVFQVDIHMEREMAPQVSQHVVDIVESNEKLANGGKIQLVDTVKVNIHDDFQTQDMNTYNRSQQCPNQMPSQDQNNSCSVHEITSPHVPIPGHMLEMSDQPECTPAAGTQDVVAQMHEVPREFGVEKTVPYKVNSERPVQHGEGALLPVVYEDRTTVSGEHLPGVLKEGNKVSGEHLPGVLKEGNKVSAEQLPGVLKERNKVSGEHIPEVLKEGTTVSGGHLPVVLKEGNKVSGEHIPGVLKEGNKVSCEHLPEVLEEGNKVSGEHLLEVLEEGNKVSGEHIPGVLEEGNKVSCEHLPGVLKEGNKVSGEHIPGVLKEGNKVSGEHLLGVLKEGNEVSGEHLPGVLKEGNEVSGEHLPGVLKEGNEVSGEHLPGVLKEGNEVSGENTGEEQSLQSEDGTDNTLHPRDDGEPSVQTEEGDDQSLQVQQPPTQQEGINENMTLTQ
ncbi:uncharacterized protein LOC124112380 isoform X2 [Haliotis rufescens]|uniref:uncharacterized protein LOC124112380 isoform X2 n=1 Tax=Haliotis rufescens TaxID=6454 RepID=UPI00201EED0B|nr:uncharacterized protein LOC124112380 isoform X2 [Haliotis rufescens]